ncbi:Hypothetical protein D9617_30g011120 [Elsinoe fawcettii]|nr:Hypothetical protein D9617_30g011120 [Elsinoe fawcettii]
MSAPSDRPAGRQDGHDTAEYLDTGRLQPLDALPAGSLPPGSKSSGVYHPMASTIAALRRMGNATSTSASNGPSAPSPSSTVQAPGQMANSASVTGANVPTHGRYALFAAGLAPGPGCTRTTHNSSPNYGQSGRIPVSFSTNSSASYHTSIGNPTMINAYDRPPGPQSAYSNVYGRSSVPQPGPGGNSYQSYSPLTHGVGVGLHSTDLSNINASFAASGLTGNANAFSTPQQYQSLEYTTTNSAWGDRNRDYNQPDTENLANRHREADEMVKDVPAVPEDAHGKRKREGGPGERMINNFVDEYVTDTTGLDRQYSVESRGSGTRFQAGSAASTTPATPAQLQALQLLNSTLSSRGMNRLIIPGHTNVNTDALSPGTTTGHTSTDAPDAATGPAPTPPAAVPSMSWPSYSTRPGWPAKSPLQQGIYGASYTGTRSPGPLVWKDTLSPEDMEDGWPPSKVGTFESNLVQNQPLTDPETQEADRQGQGVNISGVDVFRPFIRSTPNAGRGESHETDYDYINGIAIDTDADPFKCDSTGPTDPPLTVRLPLLNTDTSVPRKSFLKSLVANPIKYDKLSSIDRRARIEFEKSKGESTTGTTDSPARARPNVSSVSPIGTVPPKRSRKDVAPAIADVYSNHGILDKHADWLVGERLLTFLLEYDQGEILESSGDQSRKARQKVAKVKARAFEDRAYDRQITIEAVRAAFEAEKEQFRFDKRVKEIGLNRATMEKNLYFYGPDASPNGLTRRFDVGIYRWNKMMSSKYGVDEAVRAMQRPFDEASLIRELRKALPNDDGVSRNKRKAGKDDSESDIEMPDANPRKKSKTSIPASIMPTQRVGVSDGSPLPVMEPSAFWAQFGSDLQEEYTSTPPEGYFHAETRGYEPPSQKYARQQWQAKNSEEANNLEADLFWQATIWNASHDENGDEVDMTERVIQ